MGGRYTQRSGGELGRVREGKREVGKEGDGVSEWVVERLGRGEEGGKGGRSWRIYRGEERNKICK